MQFEEPAGHLNDIEGGKHSRLLGLRRGLEAVETGHNSIEAMNWNVCPTMLPCQLMRGREIFITARQGLPCPAGAVSCNKTLPMGTASKRVFCQKKSEVNYHGKSEF